MLPSTLLFAPRYVIPATEGALVIALVVANPTRMVRQTRWSRTVSVLLSCLVIAANLVALGLLVASLSDSDETGTSLLVAAMQVWLTDVIVSPCSTGSSTAAAR